MEGYLTPELKKKYMVDFQKNVLTCENKSCKLDKGVKEYLVRINRNPNIQSLFSKWGTLSGELDQDKSHLVFSYSKELELEIFRNIIPELLMKFNSCFQSPSISRTKSQFCYIHMSPYKQEVEGEYACNMGYFTDPEYWNVNHLRFEVKTSIKVEHTRFWKELSSVFSGLK